MLLLSTVDFFFKNNFFKKFFQEHECQTVWNQSGMTEQCMSGAVKHDF